MKMDRRSFLKVGCTLVVAAAGGAVYRAWAQGVFSAEQGPAYSPWHDWRGGATAAERIVGAGLLAANPHNSQAWFFQVTPGAVDLFADYSRQIGVIDPVRREMHIGLGCVVENMALAARAEGYAAQVTLLPDSRQREHVAHLALTPSTPVAAELFNAIPNRHTNRGPYDRARPVTAQVLEALSALAADPAVRLIWHVEPAARDTFGCYAVAAAVALVADEQQSQDSYRWWRQSWPDVQAHRDGLTVDAQTMDAMTDLAAKWVPDLSRQQNDAYFVTNVRDVLVPTAAAFGLLAVRDGMDNALRMSAGRVWQRLHLWATAHGLAMQPLNQMCERADRERQLGLDPEFGRAVSDLAGGEWYGIMPFRTGYPLRQAQPSPRRPMADVLRKAAI